MAITVDNHVLHGGFDQEVSDINLPLGIRAA